MPISAADPLLDVAGLSSGYGKIGVLRGIDLKVGAGEVVALLGPNGAGKTTLLRAVSGLLPWSGSVRFGGRDLAGSSPRDTVKSGLAHVVEGHRVFTQLDVIDNLLLAAYDLPRAERNARVEEVLTLFPEIAAKRHERAAWLSGGQQQMLAVAQGLVRRPRLSDAGRAVGGIVAGAGRSRAGRGAAAARGGNVGALGRAADREGAWRSPTVFTRWRAARSCWRRRRTKPTCRTGWSRPT